MTALFALIILLCLFGAGFYSGVEMGFYRLNRLRLALRLRSPKDRAAAAERIDACVRRPDEFVIMTLVGHNLFVFLATFACTQIYAPFWPGHADFLATATLIVPVFFLCEVLPKELLGHAADAAMYSLAGAISLSQRVLWPAVWLLVRTQRLWRLFPRYRTAPAEVEVERHRLNYFLGESARDGTLSAYQHAMAGNIMQLRALKVERVMVPRESVVSLRLGPGCGGLDACREAARGSRFRRYPVADAYGAFIGFVDILDVLGCETADGDDAFDLAEHVRRPLVFRPDDPVIDALHALRRARKPMGFVEDASGAFVGIVTIKDLVEEIVGELGAW